MKKRIAFVGGGLSSLHLAYLLRSADVECTIYEADDRLGGKIRSIQGPDGYIHEMGACYLAPSYKKVYNLLKELGYDVETHSLCLAGRECVYKGKWEQFRDWVYLEGLQFLPSIFKYLPKGISKLFFLFALLYAIRRYLTIHQKLLGSYSGFIPPCPSAEIRKELAVPFLQFLQKHQLQILIPLFKGFQTSQGYGFLEVVPTYYALIWCNPLMMQTVISQILGKKIVGGTQTNAFLLSTGLETLIHLLAEKVNAKIKLSSKVTQIQRDASGVTIRSNREEERYDFVVIGCCPSILEGILDFTPKEAALFKTMERAIISTYLVECDLPSLNKGVLTFTESLSVDKSPFFTFRNTSYFFNHINNHSKFYVATFYQRYFGESEESLHDRYMEELKKIIPNGHFTIHAKGPGNTLLHPYFPHFNAKGIMEGAPWELLRFAGDNRTLFIGSTPSFESLNAVIDYNEELMSAEGPFKKWLIRDC